MKKITIVICMIIVAISGIYFFMVDGLSDISQANSNDLTKNGKGKILYYRSPMNPNQISKVPMKDEMGMDYIPVYENELSNSGVVKIDPVVVQNMNVKTTSVGIKEISSKIVTNGVLKTNETQDYIVTTRVNGYIQKLYVNYTGQKVHKGEKLMDIYSPELVAAEQELVTALSYQYTVKNSTISHASGDELLKNAVQKLRLLEISESEINRIKETKNVKTYTTLYAQNTGTVISKNILEGQKITAGQPLMEISNLSTLWLLADIYEYELSKVKVGSKARIRFNFFPEKEFSGRITFIYPTIDPKTRTATIRIDLSNHNGLLKPNMFAKVEIDGKNIGKYPVVPEQSVIRSGFQNTVIQSLGNGKFKPINIDLGDYSNGYYQVLNGISEGDKIVTSAQFLIASESNLQSALSQFSSSSDSGKANRIIKEKPNSSSVMSLNSQKNSVKQDAFENGAIIRKGVIDLSLIDKNKDEKLFQDIMDWNVISDEAGECPICGMKLKEFRIDQVKKNLIENGFKYKK